MNVTAKSAMVLFLSVPLGCTSGSRSGPSPEPPRSYVPLPPPPPQLPPQALPCAPAQSLAMTTSLQARAALEAPGMKPEGAPVCGIAVEGQVVTGPVIPIEQGYCYSFLGQSLPPVIQMEMQLDSALPPGMTLPPGFNGLLERPLYVSTTPGERVSMAEKRTCFTWPYPPLPGTARLILRARSGSGPMAGQVFRKRM